MYNYTRVVDEESLIIINFLSFLIGGAIDDSTGGSTGGSIDGAIDDSTGGSIDGAIDIGLDFLEILNWVMIEMGTRQIGQVRIFFDREQFFFHKYRHSVPKEWLQLQVKESILWWVWRHIGQGSSWCKSEFCWEIVIYLIL